jgi:hypothetical protein
VKREGLFQQSALPAPGLQATAEEIDKRRHTRFSVAVDAEVVETKTLASATGRVTDLGVGGCYIDTFSTFPQGTQVEVRLHWRGRTLQLQAIVSYTLTGKSTGMGLSFTGIVGNQDATLLDWLNGLSDRPAQESPREAEPEVASAGNAKAVKPEDLKQAIEELVGLLVRKQLLTGSEGSRIQDRLVRSAVHDAP